MYGDVNFVLVESMLRLEASATEATSIRARAVSLLKGMDVVPGQGDIRVLAPLLIMRFGDRRSMPVLRSAFTRNMDKVPGDVLRAAVAVYASNGPKYFEETRQAASRLHRNLLAEFVRLVERVQSYTEVPDRFSNRLKLGYDPTTRLQYVDTRALLQARLLGLSPANGVRVYLKNKRNAFLASGISDYDKQLVRRLWPV